MAKQVREVYHHGRKVDGQPDKYVKLYLHHEAMQAPHSMRIVGYQWGKTCYGWSEPFEAWER